MAVGHSTLLNHHFGARFSELTRTHAQPIATVQGDLNRMGYYSTLAKDMCRQIGIVNSDVFTKCILLAHIDRSVQFWVRLRLPRALNLRRSSR